MKIEIKSVFGSVLFSGDFESLAKCVEAAVESRANLAGSNFADANLADARMAGAYLANANLARANLARVNLAGAYLADANLADANLAGARMAGANLAGAKNSALAIAMTRILPAGSLIGWKKCMEGVLVKLRIPEDATRSHAFGRKCRAEYVEVLEVIGSLVGYSNYDGGKTEYRKGKIVRCDKWNDDFTKECAGGIHFFITREEAEAYTL